MNCHEMEKRIKSFNDLKLQAARVHFLTWCIKRQRGIPTIQLKGNECCICEEFILNKGICDPL